MNGNLNKDIITYIIKETIISIAQISNIDHHKEFMDLGIDFSELCELTNKLNCKIPLYAPKNLDSYIGIIDIFEHPSVDQLSQFILKLIS